MEIMEYKFDAELWLYQGDGSWHFVTLPKDISKEIKENFGSGRPGFGSIRVEAKLGDQIWSTSIFPDKKAGAYFLPVKADIRKKAEVKAGDLVRITLTLKI